MNSPIHEIGIEDTKKRVRPAAMTPESQSPRVPESPTKIQKSCREPAMRHETD